MPKFPQPKAPGYVHPTTGRVAVLVADLADSDLNGDAPAYFYNEEAEDMGLAHEARADQADPQPWLSRRHRRLPAVALETATLPN